MFNSYANPDPINRSLTKAEATRNRPPYVIVLYKRQERQNVGFENFQKILAKEWARKLNLQNIIIVPPALPCAPRVISLVMQPYQEGECDAHGTSCLPTLPRDLKVPVRKNQ